MPSNYLEAPSDASQALINYLESVQVITGKNLTQLIDKMSTRLFSFNDIKTTMSVNTATVREFLKIAPEIKDEDIPPLEKDLNQYLSEPTVISELVSKYQQWEPNFSNDKFILDFKQQFSDFFFAPISKSSEWQAFLNKQNPPLTENDQNKIVAAFFFKIYSFALPKITEIPRTDLEKEKRFFFLRFMTSSGGEDDLKQLRELIHTNRNTYLDGKFAEAVFNLIAKQDVSAFAKELETNIQKIKESVYFKSFTKEENDKKLNEIFNKLEKDIKTLKLSEKEEVKDKNKAIKKLHEIRDKELKVKKSNEKSALKTESPSVRPRSTSPFGRPKSPFGKLFSPKPEQPDIPKPTTANITKKKGK